MKTVIQGQVVNILAINPDTGAVDQPTTAFPAITAPNIAAATSLSCPSGAVNSGTYTPTAAAGTGTPSNITVGPHYWAQIGHWVTVSGSLSILTADTNLFTVTLTLPTGAAFTAAAQAAGVANEVGLPSVGSIQADPTFAKVTLTAAAADTTQQTWVYQFSYQVQ